MNIIDIINNKRLGKELSYLEIEYAVDGYLNNIIKDYQMSSLLMAICINGMTEEETVNLTNVMLKSGNQIDLSQIDGIKVDKHSSGGIGDKTTLILAPLVSACGVKVAKMSGRALGFTGGTIDKLESIPGFNVNIDNKNFVNQVNELGVCISYSSSNLVPADKKIYALRDVTGTVASIPLIASSIMSKKIAVGADKIVIDLKVGDGAFMKSLEEAEKLANLMVKIGKQNNKEVVCVLTNMDEPLGHTVGNALEIIESVSVLQGKGPKELKDLSIYLATYMVSLGKNISLEEAEKLVIEKLNDLSAYRQFLKLVNCQGGNLDLLKIKANKIVIESRKAGYVSKIQNQKLGEIVNMLGAGRSSLEDSLDYSSGIICHKKIGDYIKEGDDLVTIYTNKPYEDLVNSLVDCFEISSEPVAKKPLIYKVVK